MIFTLYMYILTNLFFQRKTLMLTFPLNNLNICEGRSRLKCKAIPLIYFSFYFETLKKDPLKKTVFYIVLCDAFQQGD